MVAEPGASSVQGYLIVTGIQLAHRKVVNAIQSTSPATFEPQKNLTSHSSMPAGSDTNPPYLPTRPSALEQRQAAQLPDKGTRFPGLTGAKSPLTGRAEDHHLILPPI